jgi:hypothetical protein
METLLLLALLVRRFRHCASGWRGARAHMRVIGRRD